MQEPQNTKMYFYFDESGSPALLGHHGKDLLKLGLTSKTFSVGYIQTSNHHNLHVDLENLRKELMEDEYLKSIPSIKNLKNGFHANKDCSEVREKVFKLLKKSDFEAYVIVARKEEAIFRNRFNMSEKRLYRFLVSELLKNRIHLYTDIDIYFSEMGNIVSEHNMKEAIDKGVLCKYLYFPHVVELTDEEMDEYIVISEKISKYFNYSKECFTKIDDILTALLIKRKRIIHKAFNKKLEFKKIVEDRFQEQGNLKYTLVYVPEGNKPDLDYSDHFTELDSSFYDEESDHLIDQYTAIVRDLSERITVRKFTSESTDRDAMLKGFATGDIEVLTSMKCLDEGVDVPRSELAIFCASTGNPRQFVQRRGRILRTHPDKRIAIIHDLIVAPRVGHSLKSYNMERSLFKTEITRVNNFAMLSLNPFKAQQELMEILEYYNLNLFDN